MEEFFNQSGVPKIEKKKPGLRFITRTAVLLAIVLAVQSLHLPNYFTGPVVNAVLILATIFVGPWSGILIGLVTPVAALLTAIIPPVAVPLVPVIMAANATLVLIFWLLQKVNGYVAWLAAALAKFGVFYLVLNYLLQVLKIKLPAPMLVAFQLPQLYTALLGGIVALIVARYLGRVVSKEN